MAGYRELLAVEWDDHAAAIFRLNFPTVPLYHGDLAHLSIEECCTRAGLKAGALDVLDGSPPCQGFSTSGKRLMDDPRNELFREYVRLLQGLQPRAFIMENVPGLIQGKMKVRFAEILRALKASGYAVKAWLMQAQYFQVPQSRARLIFCGIRQDLGGMPSCPRPQSREISVRAAWQHLPANTSEEFAYPAWLRQAVKEIKRRETTGNRTKARAFLKYKGTTGGAHNFVRLAWERSSTTICKSFIAQAWLGHPDDERFINEVELKRLASFPDSYVLLGDFKQKVARIGNAVPPLFMRAIATHVTTLLRSF